MVTQRVSTLSPLPVVPMDQLHLSFLGPFAVYQNRKVITHFESNKVRALLCYLAVERGLHPRGQVATLLWPDHQEANARMNLRQVLYQLRRAIGDEGAEPPLLLIDRQTIGLNPTAPLTVDVLRFRDLLVATATHEHTALAACPACLERLRQAVDLYHHDFLTGFVLDDSDSFEEWRRMTQEQLHLQALDALYQLTTVARSVGDDEAVLRYAQRQLTLEPWCEEAHRQMMMAYWRRGQRRAALAQYATCRRLLAAELSIEPDVLTEALYAQIRADATPSGSDTPITPPAAVAAAGAVEQETAMRLLVTAEAPLPFPGETPVWRDGLPFPMADGEPAAVSYSRIPPLIEQAQPPMRAVAALPAHLTPFIGRTAELQAVGQALQQGVRLLTLLGPGGMGKTRLAQQVGLLQRAAYADQLYFVPLAGVTDATAVATAVATALDLRLQNVDPLHAVATFLQNQPALLILDNFEHLLHNTVLVIELLQAAPLLQVLITTRERLNVAGEHVFLVDGMGYPPPTVTAPTPLPSAPCASADPLVAARASSAIQLFVQSAQRVAPTFQLAEETRPGILRICQLVQGMPLALELAAAWLEVLPLSAIVNEIIDNVDFLETQQRHVPPRQQSMRAVFNWSWQLLDETARQALRRLAIFRGGFTREAAEAVGNIRLRTLATLIHKSLLQFNQAQTPTSYYQIHELLRQFALEQLQQSGEAAALATAHSDYYLRFLIEQGAYLSSAHAQTALKAIQQEVENIDQAWTVALKAGHLALLAKSAHALAEFYLIAGRSVQAVEFFAEAVRQLKARDWATTVIAQECQSLISTLLCFQADFLLHQGQGEAATVCIEESLTLCQVTENRWAEVNADLLQAMNLWARGEQEDAYTRLRHTFQLIGHYRAAGWSGPSLINIELSVLLWLAHITATRGDESQANAYYAEGLALARRTGNRRAEQNFLLNIAGVALLRCDWPRARQYYSEVLPIAAALGFRWSEASAQLEFGVAICHTGEYEAALAMCEQATAIFVQIHDPLKALYALLTSALIYGYLGDFAATDRCMTTAAPFLAQVKVFSARLYRWYVQSTLAWLQGHYLEGVRYATAGLDALEGQTDLLYRAHFALLLGHHELKLHRSTAAHTHYQMAFAGYTALGLPMLAAEAQSGLALLAQQTGALGDALAYVEAILPILAAHPYAGLDEPFLIYLTCYQVLSAAGEARAPIILAQGYALLQEYATQIRGDALRDSFLTHVGTHCALVEAATLHEL